MIADILRFYRDARGRLDSGETVAGTLGDYLDAGRFGRAFRNHFLVPITAAVWSTAPDRILDFPIDYLLHFLDNHGLIGRHQALQWRTITGGSQRYVDAILATLPADAVRAGDPVRVRHARCGRRDGPHPRRRARSGSTRSSWPPTRTTRWRCSRTRTSASGTTLGGFDYTTNQVVLHTDERLLPTKRRAWASWNVEMPDCRTPGRRAHHDLPHEPAAVAARAAAVLRVGQPGRSRAARPGHRRAAHEPPDVHLPDPRRPAGRAPRSRAGGARGTPARTWATASTRTAAAPGSRPRRRIGAAVAAARRVRSHLLEGKVRHRRSRPFVYALEHDVWYVALDLDELDAVPRSLRLLSRNRPNLVTLRDRDHLLPPATDLRADAARAPAGRGRGPDRLADDAGDEPAGLRLRLQPGELLPLPRPRRGRSRVVIIEVHNTHGERRLYTLRPERRGASHHGGDGQGLLRLAVHRHGGALPGARPRRARRACGSRSTRPSTASRCWPRASRSRGGG